jgi:hypothetical protein
MGLIGSVEKLSFVAAANVVGQTGALITEVVMSLVRLTGYNLGVLNGWGSTFVVVQRGFNEVYKYLLHIPEEASKEQR